MPRPDAASRALAGLALLLGIYLYLGRLGGVPLQTGNEAMYDAPPISMLESRDFLVPRWHGTHFLDKPPLSFWLIAGSYTLFGVSVPAARLPAALAALGTVLAVGLWARRRRGPRAGLLAATVLLFSYSFWTFTRYYAADAVLTLAVTLAILALDACCRAREGSDALLGAMAGAALGVAFLAKGLPGIVLPIGAVATGLLFDRTRPVRWKPRGIAVLAVLLAAIAPWHVAMARRLGSEFWRVFYWDNQFVRGTTERFMRSPRSPLSYLPVVAYAVFPWSVVLPASLRRRKPSSVPLAWLLFGLAFWSLLVMKRDVYLMPLFPAIALLVGERLDAEATLPSRALRYAWAAAALALLAALGLLGYVFGPVAMLAGRDAVVFLVAAVGLELAAVVVALRSAGKTAAVLGVALACGLSFWALDHVNQRLARYDPIPDWGERVRAAACGEGCDLYLVDVNANDIEFYSRQGWKSVTRPERIPSSSIRRGFLVMRTDVEPSLSRLAARSEVLDRRPWLPGDWLSRILARRQWPVERLSLVRLGTL